MEFQYFRNALFFPLKHLAELLIWILKLHYRYLFELKIFLGKIIFRFTKKFKSNSEALLITQNLFHFSTCCAPLYHQRSVYELIEIGATTYLLVRRCASNKFDS